MNKEQMDRNVHDLIREAHTMEGDKTRELAIYLLSAVLETVVFDGDSRRNIFGSSYFWEKIDKALKIGGYEARPIKKVVA